LAGTLQPPWRKVKTEITMKTGGTHSPPATPTLWNYIKFNSMKNQKIIWWILIALWCAGIFYQSSKPGHESVHESMFIVTVLNHWFAQILGPNVIVITDNLVRKAAHFLEYLVLGSLLFQGYLNRSRLWLTALCALGTGILYAASDELHQYFVPGRHMRLIDLAVDSSGVLVGTCIFLYFLYFAGKRRLVRL
jgi:VanZ family protein